ncbi:MAG: hypothetical protein HKN39_01990 [Flavobacteriales bacterium]|nr:hypothetical protein [Flavobacteriales bacterium]
MARRDLPTLATGSMADIAFLLLVFWLMTTTLDPDIGIIRILPSKEKSPPKTVDPINVLEVYTNMNNEILVENELVEINQLRSIARNFLSNSGVLNEEKGDISYTQRRPVNTEYVLGKIQQIESRYSRTGFENAQISNDTLNAWRAKLQAIEYFGEYRELKPSAVISIQNDKATSYDLYIQVQNELTAALNELRNELSLHFFNVPYDKLDDKTDKEKILAIQQVFPQRISEAELVDKR